MFKDNKIVSVAPYINLVVYLDRVNQQAYQLGYANTAAYILVLAHCVA